MKKSSAPSPRHCGSAPPLAEMSHLSLRAGKSWTYTCGRPELVRRVGDPAAIAGHLWIHARRSRRLTGAVRGLAAAVVACVASHRSCSSTSCIDDHRSSASFASARSITWSRTGSTGTSSPPLVKLRLRRVSRRETPRPSRRQPGRGPHSGQNECRETTALRRGL